MPLKSRHFFTHTFCFIFCQKIALLSYENGVIYGDLHSSVLKKSIQFHNLTELVLMMDQIMKDLNIHEYNERYYHVIIKKPSLDVELDYQELKQDNFEKYLNRALMYPKKSKDIFTVKVMYRQNNTWQGEMTWLRTNRTRFFRSALELAELIYSVIDKYHQ